MALKIYSSPTPSAAFSIDGSFDNPLLLAFDGVTGGIINKRYYVRNDDNTLWYSSIVIQPIYTSGDNIAEGANGFAWKLIAGDDQPLEEQWSLLAPGNSISIPNIGSPSGGDISTYEPFWLRIIVPRGAPIKSHQGIVLNISGTATLV